LSLALYALDKARAYYNYSTRSVETISATANEDTGVVRLELSLRSGKHLGHSAGQYCFVNIPEISLTQWHPFSISSSPGEQHFTMHIKRFGGPDQFTSRLFQRVLDQQQADQGPHPDPCVSRVSAVVDTAGDRLDASSFRSVSLNSSGDDKLGMLEQGNWASGASMSVNVDGPYGFPGIRIHDDFEELLLVAGGIGVTPIASVLADILDRHASHQPDHEPNHKLDTSEGFFGPQTRSRSNCISDTDLGRPLMSDAGSTPKAAMPTNVRRVRFVWSSRDRALFDEFAPLIERARASELVQVELYCTSQQAVGGSPTGKSEVECVMGRRPNVDEIMKQAAAQVNADDRAPPIGVFICGPMAMVETTKEVCMKHGNERTFAVHDETFLL
jgi:ferredoxin-NADP reductase